MIWSLHFVNYDVLCKFCEVWFVFVHIHPVYYSIVSKIYVPTVRAQNETHHLTDAILKFMDTKQLQLLEWLSHCRRKVDVVHQLHHFILGDVLPATILNPRPLGVANVVRQWNSVKVGVSRSYAEQFACCILPLPQCQHAKCFGRWDQSLGRYTADMGLPVSWMFVSHTWNRKKVSSKIFESMSWNGMKFFRTGSKLAMKQLVNTKTCLLNLSFSLADSTFCPDAIFPRRLNKLLDISWHYPSTSTCCDFSRGNQLIWHNVTISIYGRYLWSKTGWFSVTSKWPI